MSPNGQASFLPWSDVPFRHGFTESHSENMLRDSILLAAALTEAPAVLILRDDTGTWYRDSSGLTGEELAEVEPALAPSPVQGAATAILQGHGLRIIESLPLVDLHQRIIGTLAVLSGDPITLTATQREGLRLLASHIQTIVAIDRQKLEARSAPRAPTAASFVPGLIHELGGFIFGISASLDAFEARFADLEEVAKYAGNIRRGLERMSAFIVELREYGDPRRLSWSPHDLVPLLLAALERLAPSAEARGVRLRLSMDGLLPPIHADGQNLQAAFASIIDLVLQQEEPGRDLVVHAAATRQGDRDLICGYLDGSGLRFKDVDPARLFEPFYFRTSGLGRLALPGARRMFESHGGTLTAGPGPGGGLRIAFMLPAAADHPLRSASQA